MCDLLTSPLCCCEAVIRICRTVCKLVSANKDATLINAVCPFLSSSQKLDLGSWRLTSNWTNWARYVRECVFSVDFFTGAYVLIGSDITHTHTVIVSI